MAELPRYQQVETYEPARPSMGQAQALQSLSQKLAAFTQGQQRQADIFAAQEAERAGQAAAAGKKGGVEMRQPGTIRADAFNKGALMAHAAAIQTDIRETTARLETTFATNMEGFQQALDSYKEGLFTQIDPMLRPYAETDINQYAASSRTRIFNATFAQQMEENLAEINKAAEGLTGDAMRAYREGDLEAAATAQEKLFFTWEQGVIEGVLDRGKVDQARAAFDKNADQNWILGEFDRVLRNEGIDAATKAFDKFRGEKTKDLTPEAKDQVLTRMQTLMSAEYTRQGREAALVRAEQEAREKMVKGQVDSVKKALTAGNIPPNIDDVLQQAEGTKYYAELQTELAIARQTSDFAMLNPDAQAAVITQMKSRKDLTGEEVALLDRYEKAHNYVMEGLNKDSFSLAVEQGYINNVQPLDLNNPESIEMRRMQAETASAIYGRRVSPISSQEAAQFTEAMVRGTADEQQAMMQSMVTGFGDQTMDVFDSMFKEGAGSYAIAGGLMMEGRPSVARNVFLGMEQMKTNKEIIAKDFDLEFGNGVGNVYAMTPKHMGALRDATRALYAQKMAMQGMFAEKENVDSATLQEAINEITGGIVVIEWNGSGIFSDDNYKIEAPAPGMDDSDTEDWLSGITAGHIEAMGGTTGISSADVAELVSEQRVQLISIGAGRYNLQTYTGNFIMDRNGNPFELTYSKDMADTEVGKPEPVQ